MIALKPEPLTKTSFAPFGDVIEIEGVQHFPINQGFAERFNDLARVDVGAEGGSVNISIVNAVVRPKPIALKLMERHPLGSQIFYPLQDRRRTLSFFNLLSVLRGKKYLVLLGFPRGTLCYNFLGCL